MAAPRLRKSLPLTEKGLSAVELITGTGAEPTVPVKALTLTPAVAVPPLLLLLLLLASLFEVSSASHPIYPH